MLLPDMSRPRILPSRLTAVVACLWLAASGWVMAAQDFDKYSPKLPDETGIVDPKKERKAPTIQKQGEKPAPSDTPSESTAPSATTTTAPAKVPSIRVEKLQPETSSAFEDIKPVVPGESMEGRTDSAFAEVMPRVPEMPDEYLAAIETAIQPYMDEVLLPSLNGLVFVDKPDQIQPEGLESSGVRASNLPDLESPAFKAIAGKYIGQPVTLRSLNELNKEVVAFYGQNDYPVVDVIVPEQDITKGTVQLVVLQGQLGVVKVEGNRWFSDNLLSNEIRLEQGRIIRAKKLMADLNWLNRNPFRRVNLVYSRGEDLAETDLILQVQDRFPVRFYTGYENSGSDATGDNRFFAGFNWGNAFGLDHRASYQFTFNNDLDRFAAHSGSYEIPLPWRHILGIYGGQGTSEANTLQTALISSEGESITAGMRYTIPLTGVGTFEHELAFGFEYKDTTTDFSIGGVPEPTSFTEIGHFLASYTAGQRDAWGGTSFTGSVFFSPGDLTDNNNDVDFQTIRPFAESEYVYSRVTLERIFSLPENFSLVGRFTGQLASGNLLSSEQLGVGGYATIRGYEEREVNADEGFYTNAELRSPPLSLASLFKLGDVPQDQLQALLFWDYAAVSLSDPIGGQDPNLFLSSFGPGVRYSINPYLSFRFDYGFQLMDSGQPSRFNSRAHLGMVLSY
jgi:hemolysin activation/secretion protein